MSNLYYNFKDEEYGKLNVNITYQNRKIIFVLAIPFIQEGYYRLYYITFIRLFRCLTYG